MKTNTRLSVLLIAWSFAASGPTLAKCSPGELRGLFGLTTQALGSAGIEGTTLSLFDFKNNHSVDEVYFVNTGNASWKSTATGNFSVTPDCHLSLTVKDPGGTLYALEGRINPNNKVVNVLQTQPNNEDVSIGVMRPVGLKRCHTDRFIGRYGFLSQGRVPVKNDSLTLVPESRLGWFIADGAHLEQPVEWVNTNGVISKTPPTQIPSDTLDSCLIDLGQGGFAGVIVERGHRALYMDLAKGSYRIGTMLKVR